MDTKKLLNKREKKLKKKQLEAAAKKEESEESASEVEVAPVVEVEEEPSKGEGLKESKFFVLIF